MVQDSWSILKSSKFTIMITGSAGMGIAKDLNISFVQEVVASTKAIKHLILKLMLPLNLVGKMQRSLILKME